MYRYLSLSAASLAVALAVGVPAHAGVAADDATKAKITEQLTSEGYEVRKIDFEDGMIEVYALKDGKKLELYLDASLKVVKTKEAD